MENFVTSEKNI